MPDTRKREEPYPVPRRRDSACPVKPDPPALARLLDEWMRGDEREQRETFEALRHFLDEDRPVGYKLLS